MSQPEQEIHEARFVEGEWCIECDAHLLDVDEDGLPYVWGGWACVVCGRPMCAACWSKTGGLCTECWCHANL